MAGSNPPILVALEALPGRPKVNRQGWHNNLPCPNSAAHKNGDRNPSFGWKVSDDGRAVLLKCFSGCQTEDIVGVLGHTMSDLFSPPDGTDRQYFGSHVYPYRDAVTGKTHLKFRLDWRGADGTTGKEARWDDGAPAASILWYRYEALDAEPDGPVIIVEGEKAADALAHVLEGTAYVVIAAPSASYDPPGEAIERLTGRNVGLWPDDDVEPTKGHALMKRIASRLDPLKVNVFWVAPRHIRSTLKDGWDAADWAEALTPEQQGRAGAAVGLMLTPEDPGPRPRLILRDLALMDYTPPVRPLLGMLHPEGWTMLYGKGSAGKGTICAALACDLITTRGHRVAILDYENHRNEWVARLRRLYFERHREELPPGSVVYVAPNDPSSGLPLGSFMDHADELRLSLRAAGVTYVILDSIVGGATLGHDPKDDVTVGLFDTARQRLALPLLSLGHIPKNSLQTDMPYGSAFWYHLPRSTWFAEQLPRAFGSPGFTVSLVNHKFSDSTPQPPLLGIVKYDGGWLQSVLIARDESALVDLTAAGKKPGKAPTVEAIVLGIIDRSPGVGFTAGEVLGEWPTGAEEPEVRTVSDRLSGLVKAGRAVLVEGGGGRGKVAIYRSVLDPDKPPTETPHEGFWGDTTTEPPTNPDESER